MNKINAIANLYFGLMFTLNAYEECEQTNIYKQDFKKQGNLFKNKVKKHLAEFQFMFEKNTEATENIYDHIEQLMQQLVNITPTEIGIINTLLIAHKENPARFNSLCAMNKIKIIDVD